MQGSVMSGQPCGEPQRSAGAQGLVIARQREARQMGVGLRRAAQSELWESAQAGPIAAAGSRASGSLGRGTARALLGGPLALAAALGLTAFVALRLPWLEADRLVAAEFLLPTAWAVGAIWATMDSKLTRVAVTLGLTAIVCVGGTVA